MSKSVVPKTCHFLAHVNPCSFQIEEHWIPQLKAWAQANNIKGFTISIEEIVDWDIILMRGFLHAGVLPAFKRKIADAYKHPKDGAVFTVHGVKQFLKAKFLGFKRNAAYDKWKAPLNLDVATMDILGWINLQDILSAIKDPPVLTSTEDLSPVLYWTFLNDLEAYYFELFHDAYDTRDMPEKPEGV